MEAFILRMHLKSFSLKAFIVIGYNGVKVGIMEVEML